MTYQHKDSTRKQVFYSNKSREKGGGGNSNLKEEPKNNKENKNFTT